MAGALRRIPCAPLRRVATPPPTPEQALYARHGFRHLADKPLAPQDPAAPVLAVMMRPPATATAAGDGQ